MDRDVVEPYIARIAGEADAIIDALTLPASLAAVLTDVCAMTAAADIDRDPITEDRARNQLLKSAQDKTRIDLGADPETALLRLSQACAVMAATPVAQETRPFRGPSASDAAVSGLGCGAPPRRSLPFAARTNARAFEPFVLHSPGPPQARMSRRTEQLLRMGDDCLRLIRNGKLGEADSVDYRLAVAPWSQALEHEMAELLGHEVRAGLGVTLPEFHWRRQPGLSDVAIRSPSQRDPISFNQARPNSPDPDRALWQPPTMGPLRLGWEAWRASNSMPVPRELVELLLQCKDFRNAAAQPGEPILFETACEARAAIRRAIGMIAELGIRSWARHH